MSAKDESRLRTHEFAFDIGAVTAVIRFVPVERKAGSLGSVPCCAAQFPCRVDLCILFSLNQIHQIRHSVYVPLRRGAILSQ